VVFVKTLRWPALAVVSSQLGTVIYFLAFNDYWITNVFKFGNIRYWLWLLPFLWLYTYLTVTRAWRSLGWIATCALIAAPLAVWSTYPANLCPLSGRVEFAGL
jgi:hypothetical protein